MRIYRLGRSQVIHMIQTSVPMWVTTATAILEHETVIGTVSSKGGKKKRFGFFNPKCCSSCFTKKGMINEYTLPQEEWHHERHALLQDGYKEYPAQRCKPHISEMRKWQRALDIFVKLDEQRMNAEMEHLRFVTKTRKEWNLLVPMDDLDKLQEIQNKHKQTCLRSARNWRNRNRWWINREAIGQYWPECTHNAEWNGLEFVGIRLHFHVHAILVSKYLDNRPIRDCCERPCNCPVEMKGEVVDDSKFYQEWGGIVNVRSVKDYKVKYTVKGIDKYGCGKKACMQYLTKYITKAADWKSGKIGKW